ncbi:MAG: glycosyltransferase [Saprospiraceae bacterium]|nr:glycosyltransferase [Saprospiraceae bacterium]
MMAIAIFGCIVYAALIAWIMYGWTATKEIELTERESEWTPVTIIIPCRNEEDNIEACIRSIQKLRYPVSLLEVIVIDDHSTDHTADIVTHYPGVKYIKLTENQGKKAAIAEGVALASFDTVALLDGDCTVGKNWLQAIHQGFVDTKAEMLTGPVMVDPRGGFLPSFEFLETATMMAITANGHHRQKYFLANGANMAFRKQAFYTAGGFGNNEEIASGDDVFLFRNAVAHQIPTAFLKCKEAVVITGPQAGIWQLLTQRKRWATKTKAYASKAIWTIQTVVFAMALFTVITFLLGLYYDGKILFAFLLLVLVKGLVDWIFLYRMASWFGHKKPMVFFIPAQALYLVTIIYSGIMALWPTPYEWKERNIKF